MRLEVEWDFVEFGHIFLETKKNKNKWKIIDNAYNDNNEQHK